MSIEDLLKKNTEAVELLSTQINALTLAIAGERGVITNAAIAAAKLDAAGTDKVVDIGKVTADATGAKATRTRKAAAAPAPAAEEQVPLPGLENDGFDDGFGGDDGFGADDGAEVIEYTRDQVNKLLRNFRDVAMFKLGQEPGMKAAKALLQSLQVANMNDILEENFTAAVLTAITAAKKSGFYDEFASKADEAGIQL